MIELNLPAYPFKIRTVQHRRQIFDEYRRKYVVLTPEEWVRQHVIRWLVEDKQYPKGLLNVECTLLAGTNQRRADAVFFSRNGNPLLIVECKAPEVGISQDVFDQIARYNMLLKSEALMVSNGLVHYVCKLDYRTGGFSFLRDIPAWEELCGFSAD